MEKEINVFLSQPMNGVEESEILDNMTKVRDWISSLAPEGTTVHVIDNYHHTTLPPEHCGERASRLWYLGQSIQLLGDADLMPLLIPRNVDYISNGCLVELRAAERYDIPSFYILNEIPPEEEYYTDAVKRLIDKILDNKYRPHF